MKSLTLPLVDWGMGAALIGFFAVVCIGLVLVVYSLAKGDKSVDDVKKSTNNATKTNDTSNTNDVVE